MKTIDKTKLTVLSIGMVTVLVSLIGAVMNLNLMEYFFPLYTGLTLTGVALLNKNEVSEGETNKALVK